MAPFSSAAVKKLLEEGGAAPTSGMSASFVQSLLDATDEESQPAPSLLERAGGAVGQAVRAITAPARAGVSLARQSRESEPPDGPIPSVVRTGAVLGKRLVGEALDEPEPTSLTPRVPSQAAVRRREPGAVLPGVTPPTGSVSLGGPITEALAPARLAQAGRGAEAAMQAGALPRARQPVELPQPAGDILPEDEQDAARIPPEGVRVDTTLGQMPRQPDLDTQERERLVPPGRMVGSARVVEEPTLRKMVEPRVRAIQEGLNRSIEGLVWTTLTGEPLTPTEDRPYEPALIDKALETVASFATPLTMLTFAVGHVPGAAAARALTQGIVRQWGPQAAGRAFTRLAATVPPNVTGFAAFDAVRDTLEQAGALRTGAQDGFDVARVGRAAVKGAGLGAALGAPLGLLRAPLLRLGAEIGVFASYDPVLEGRAPTAQDLLDAGVAIGALKAVGRIRAGARVAVEKPRAQRTPDEQQLVDRLPLEVKAQVVMEALAETKRRLVDLQERMERTITETPRVLEPVSEPERLEQRVAELETPAPVPEGRQEPVAADVSAPPTSEAAPAAPQPMPPTRPLPARATPAPGEPEPLDLGSDVGFTPSDPAHLVRFVRARGGLAPSPTGDLAGEYQFVPLYLRNRRGLSPDRMAEAIAEETGQPFSDADLLSLIKRLPRAKQEVAARPTEEDAVTREEERLTEQEQDRAAWEALPEPAQLATLISQRIPEDLARRMLAQSKPMMTTPEPTPREAIRQALRDFAEAHPEAEDTARDLFDGLPDFRDRFGTFEAVVRRHYGGDPAAVEADFADARRQVGARFGEEAPGFGAPEESTPPLPTGQPRTEPTPLGEQVVVPGTPGRQMPPTPLRPETRQRPVEETPLFGREPTEDQPRLFEPAPVFYSTAERVIEAKMPARAFVPQVRAILQSGAVKADELKWSGLDDWLGERREQKVSKAEVIDFLRQNQVRVEEVVKGAPREFEWQTSPDGAIYIMGKASIERLGNGLFRVDMPSLQSKTFPTLDEAKAHAEDALRSLAPRDTKFGKFTLPGAQPGSYRELLLTLPERPSSSAAQARERLEVSLDRLDALANGLRAQLRNAILQRPFYQRIGERGAESARARAQTIVARLWDIRGHYPDAVEDANDLLGVSHPQLKAFREEIQRNYDLTTQAQEAERNVPRYRSPHFDEPNVLAHVRFNDRVDAEGQRVLFIEEIQSDWHQEGRRKGYALTELPADRYSVEKQVLGERGERWVVRDRDTGRPVDEGATEAEARARALRFLNDRGVERAAGAPVPAAPFAKTWHELALRRMLRWASEQGYDRIAWTTGEQQENRYWGDQLIQPAVLRWNELTKPDGSGQQLADYFGSELASMPPLKVVDAAMLPSLKNDKVRQAVIQAIPVDVVNVLAKNGFTPEQLFSKNNVVSDTLSVDSRATVARGLAGALHLTGTRLRAALDRVLSAEPTGRDEELIPAISASDLDARVVVSLLSLPRRADLRSDIGASASRDARARDRAEAPMTALGGDLTGVAPKLTATQLAEALNRHAQIVAHRTGKPVEDLLVQPPPGEGMRAFYDQILPSFLSKYGKKWGARVGTADIPNEPGRGGHRLLTPEGTEALTIPGEGPFVRVHALDITPAMRRSVVEEGQGLFEPRPRYTLRQDAAPDAHANAQGVIDDLQRAAERLSGLGPAGRPEGVPPGDVSRPGAESAADVRPGDAALRAGDVPAGRVPVRGRASEVPSGVRTLALGITRDLADRGFVDLRGREARDDAQLALLWQVWRDPRLELAHMVAVKGDTIVAHQSFTSRAPGGASPFFTGDLPREFFQLRRWLDRTGADGYWILHNHPSGEPRPSEVDVSMTGQIAKGVPGFRGHVVIDSGKYGLITVDSQGRPQAIVRTLPEAGRETLLAPSAPHDILGWTMETPEAVSFWGKRLAEPGQVGVFYRAATGRVRAAQLVPEALFQRPEDAAAWIRGQRRAVGGRDAVAFSDNPAMAEAGRALVDRRELRGIVIGGENLAGHIPRDPTGTVRVQEPAPPFGTEERQFTLRPYLKRSDLLPAEAERFADFLRRQGEAVEVRPAPGSPTRRQVWARPAETGRVDVPGRTEPPAPTEPVAQPGNVHEIPPATGGGGGARRPPDFFGDPLQRPPDDLPNRAANINLDRLVTPDAVKQEIKDVAAAFRPEIEAQRRHTVPFEEMRRLANDAGVDEATVRRVALGEAWNAEHLLAVRRLLVASAERLHGLHERVFGGSDADLARFAEALQRHVAIQKTVSGLTAEAGRALAQFRIPAGATPEAYRAIIESLGGREVTEEIAGRIARMNPADVRQLTLFVKKAVTPTWRDKLFEAWISGLLSAPTTHLVNTTSNTVAALERMSAERTVTGAIDWLRATVTGTPQERFAGEARAEFYGLLRGLQDGVAFAGKAWATEQPQFGGAQIEARRQAIGGQTGRLVRIPLRALTAEDEFMKAVAYQTSLHALAYRTAAREGLTGQARLRRMATLAAEPTPDLVKQAQAEAAIRTFTQDAPKFVREFLRLRDHDPTMLMRIVFPFVKTPTNIVIYGLERTPLNFVRVAYQAGALGRLGLAPPETERLRGGRLSEEVAKPVVGTLLAAGIAALALSGAVTGGGPTDPRERSALRATGWQPYSVRLGPLYVGYGRLEPLGMIFGLAADAAETWEDMTEDQRAKAWQSVHQAITENLSNKTFLRGLRDATRAWSDPERYGQAWLEGVAGTVVPTGVAHLARVVDPTMRRAEGVEEAVRARIPGLSTTLPPRRDLWGRPIILEGLEGASRVASPAAVSLAKDDLPSREVVRLGLRVSTPSRRLGGLELTVAEHDQYIALAGEAAYDGVERLIRSPRYERMDDLGRSDAIRDAIEDARRLARTRLLREIPAAERRDRQHQLRWGRVPQRVPEGSR